MPFRPPLNLSEILTSFDLWRDPQVELEERDDRSQETEDGLKFPVPALLGAGPEVWSSSTELAVRILPCWDVNGYYAALGAHPRATRRELREAYQAADGQSSAYLTYVFKQLLDPESRAAYDAAPLGSQYLDEYTEQMLIQRAYREAGSRCAAGQFTSATEVLDDWGYAVADAPSGVDSVRSAGQDQERRPTQSRGWGYSYYGWRTSSYYGHAGLLQRWQDALALAATNLRVSPAISLGITAMSEQPFILERVGPTTVVFFSEDADPDPQVAEQAIRELLTSSPQLPSDSPNSPGTRHP